MISLKKAKLKTYKTLEFFKVIWHINVMTVKYYDRKQPPRDTKYYLNCIVYFKYHKHKLNI